MASEQLSVGPPLKIHNAQVIGDETWIYQYDPESKRPSSRWVFARENISQCIRSQSIEKQMVGFILLCRWTCRDVPLETQRTVTAMFAFYKC